MAELQTRLGRNVRAIRRARQMSAEELGEACGVSRATITQIERGQAWPRPDNLAGIRSALDVDWNTLLGGTGDDPSQDSFVNLVLLRLKALHARLAETERLATNARQDFEEIRARAEKSSAAVEALWNKTDAAVRIGIMYAKALRALRRGHPELKPEIKRLFKEFEEAEGMSRRELLSAIQEPLEDEE